VSCGAARREPLWRQPRDERVPLPPATFMPLSLPCSRQGAITLSVPCSALSSLRWTNTFVRPLLCACGRLMKCTSSLGYLNCTRGSGCLIPSWLISPELGLLPSLSLVCCHSLPVCCRSLWPLVIFVHLVFQRCPGSEGSLNEARHGSLADPVWSSAPACTLPQFLLLVGHLVLLPGAVDSFSSQPPAPFIVVCLQDGVA
jgi:hypothetical protein